MYCNKCGTELANGVLFCRECGAKVETTTCSKCGAKLENGMNFCSNCGAAVEQKVHSTNDDGSIKIIHNSETRSGDSRNTARDISFQIGSYISRVSSNVPQSINQTAKNNTNKLIYTTIAVVGMCIILLLLSGISKQSSDSRFDSDPIVPDPEISVESNSEDDLSIEKGTTYAYMSDEWNVYIATAISDSVIKIDKWNKTLLTTKKMSYNSEIGSFKITDKTNGFAWIDDKHTAFMFNFSDKNNSDKKKISSSIFTISINDDDENKGTDYNEQVSCYSYTNDDWHMYRAIPLTDSLIKIECWSRGMSTGNFLFGYDWCLINCDDKTTDFEWADDEHTAFTITMRDLENKYYWKESKLISFVQENDGYTYDSVYGYLKGIARQKPERNGFVEGNTVTKRIGSYTFEVPKYWETDTETEDQYKAFADDPQDTILFDSVAEFDEEDEVGYFWYDDEVDHNGYVDNWLNAFDGSVLLLDEMQEFNGLNGNMIVFSVASDKFHGMAHVFNFPSIPDNKWVTLVLIEGNHAQYSYLEDFYKTLESLTEEQSNEEPESADEENGETIHEAVMDDIENVEPVNEESENNNSDDVSDKEVLNAFDINEEESQNQGSEYELAYERVFSGYTLYYLIDTDKKEIIMFSSSDGYGYYGTYTGDTSSKISVNYPTAGYTETITFENDGKDVSVLMEGDSTSFAYKSTTVEKAEKKLKTIN